jgi:repressor LexA
MASVGSRIKRIRTDLGFSQVDFANKIGVSKQTLYKYENDLITNIPSDKIEAAAKVGNVTPAYLMGWEDSSHSQSIPSFPNIHPIAQKTFPLFDGIAAGQPRLMPDGVTLYVDATVEIKADYVLKVHGNSMTGARINDGDYVFIREQPEVENGEIAAIAIGDEATLKRFYKYGDMVILRAENPEFKEMTFSGQELEQVRVLGKAVAFQSDVR